MIKNFVDSININVDKTITILDENKLSEDQVYYIIAFNNKPLSFRTDYINDLLMKLKGEK